VHDPGGFLSTPNLTTLSSLSTQEPDLPRLACCKSPPASQSQTVQYLVTWKPLLGNHLGESLLVRPSRPNIVPATRHDTALKIRKAKFQKMQSGRDQSQKRTTMQNNKRRWQGTPLGRPCQSVLRRESPPSRNTEVPIRRHGIAVACQRRFRWLCQTWA
jgi:hypothetical protein